MTVRTAPAPASPKATAPAAPDPEFLNSEAASEAAEYIRLGRESMQDSAWFEASEYLDSASTDLAALDTEGTLDPSGRAALHAYRDSVSRWLMESMGQSARLGQAEDLSQYLDHQIEEVPVASLEDLENILPRLADRNFDLDLPTPLPDAVLKALRVFTGSGRGYFEKWLQRKSRYDAMVTAKLDQRGMPHDLMYLAMVESGFNPQAWSHASASGMWQFISATGKRYGLRNDWWEDGRRDPARATDAALDYLQALHAEFGDWHLAMAAYNCGERRIERQTARTPGMTYWEMSLPSETRFYVPKILAAMIIGHNPAAFGFHIEENALAPLRFDTVTVQRCMPLRGIALATGIHEDTLKLLNPSLRRWCTPPGRSAFTLNVPEGTRDLFYANSDRIETVSPTALHRHTVARGQTLAAIARMYGVSASSIRRANGLRGTRVRTGRSLIIPMPGAGGPEDDDSPREASSRAASDDDASVAAASHKVRSGETLSSIARQYKVSVTALRRVNGLKSRSHLKVGQKIRIPASSRMADAEPSSVFTPTTSRKTYVVRKGDNLSRVASRLRVSQASLRAWNGLQGSALRPGQKIRYEVSGGIPGGVLLASSLDAEEYYRIQNGDNLTEISSRFGQSVDNLRKLNDNLQPQALRPGQKIRVR